MMDLRYEALQINLEVNPSGMTGDLAADSKLAYVQSLKAGRAVTVDANGYIALVDSASSTSLIGFLLLDAEGSFFENKPALSSRRMAVTASSTEFETDQFVSTETIATGALVYVGTGANVGLLTAVKPAAGTLTAAVGVVTKGNTAESPTLRVVTQGPVA